MKILILVLSADFPPYDKMIQTAKETWDSVEVEGLETVYYCGKSVKQNYDNVIYLPVKEGYMTMGEKCIQAFEWALNNKEFDYIARVHSSCYVNKKQLKKYVEGLSDTNLFSGIEATSQNGFQYLWGGGHYIISRDVIKSLIDNKSKWNHKLMEDEAMSVLCTQLNIPFTWGRSCSINKRDNDWLLLSYGGESKEFTEWEQLKDCTEHFYRVKQDMRRDVDGFIMNELFKTLK